MRDSSVGRVQPCGAELVGRVRRLRRNPPPIGEGGLRFANPPYLLRAPLRSARRRAMADRSSGRPFPVRAELVGRVGRLRRNPPPIGEGGLRFANPPYLLPAPFRSASRRAMADR